MTKPHVARRQRNRAAPEHVAGGMLQAAADETVVDLEFLACRCHDETSEYA